MEKGWNTEYSSVKWAQQCPRSEGFDPFKIGFHIKFSDFQGLLWHWSSVPWRTFLPPPRYSLCPGEHWNTIKNLFVGQFSLWNRLLIHSKRGMRTIKLVIFPIRRGWGSSLPTSRITAKESVPGIGGYHHLNTVSLYYIMLTSQEHQPVWMCASVSPSAGCAALTVDVDHTLDCDHYHYHDNSP